jgi:anthranilate synthase component 1
MNILGGAIGYVSFDCIKYFEPRTDKKVEDNLKLPESLHMFCDDLVIFDHLYQIVKIVTHIKGDIQNPSYLADQYKLAQARLEKIADTLVNAPVELPEQKPIKLGNEYSENCNQERYEGFVKKLQSHIVKGDIIQAVPSRRLARPTDLHPFNVYRHLRQVNPAPYLFFLDCKDFQVVGASPEMLVKVDSDRKVYTHPIAGTRKRGKTEEEDLALEKDLLSDRKEIAEHTMLVDLGRNDVNRICKPTTTKVDSLMHIEKYSHVMHIVSNVSGILRDDQTPFDAFRSIFPAGTVSGAPKVKAIELIRELEGETRGVYAGSVGHFDYSGTIDTCIAIRTMLFKDGVAYLQAGGGIVHHSNPEDEYHETVNKLNSNVATLAKAESYYANQ